MMKGNSIQSSTYCLVIVEHMILTKIRASISQDTNFYILHLECKAVHVTSAMIGDAGSKMPICTRTYCLVLVNHVMCAKIGVTESETPIFVMNLTKIGASKYQATNFCLLHQDCGAYHVICAKIGNVRLKTPIFAT